MYTQDPSERITLAGQWALINLLSPFISIDRHLTALNIYTPCLAFSRIINTHLTTCCLFKYFLSLFTQSVFNFSLEKVLSAYTSRFISPLLRFRMLPFCFQLTFLRPASSKCFPISVKCSLWIIFERPTKVFIIILGLENDY